MQTSKLAFWRFQLRNVIFARWHLWSVLWHFFFLAKIVVNMDVLLNYEPEWFLNELKVSRRISTNVSLVTKMLVLYPTDKSFKFSKDLFLCPWCLPDLDCWWYITYTLIHVKGGSTFFQFNSIQSSILTPRTAWLKYIEIWYNKYIRIPHKQNGSQKSNAYIAGLLSLPLSNFLNIFLDQHSCIF